MESSAHDYYQPPANQAPSKPLKCRVEPSPRNNNSEKPKDNIYFDCKHLYEKGRILNIDFSLKARRNNFTTTSKTRKRVENGKLEKTIRKFLILGKHQLRN